MDTVDSKTRSKMMSSVRSKDTKLEVEIRKRLFAMGFRYRLHPSGLPGRPDLVLKKHKTVIFINGCFWHLHGCEFSSIPQTRTKWWKEKLEGNRKRDLDNIRKLHKEGWKIVIIWECAIRKAKADMREKMLDNIAKDIKSFLSSKHKSMEIDCNGKRYSINAGLL